MVIIGIDAHKRSHTAVVVDEQGRQLAQRTTGTSSSDHLQLLAWTAEYGSERLWAVEDCRHLSRRLEHDLLAAGERILRVPPKLMANTRDGARTFGKSDPIDALAVARAVLRETDLPVARLDGPEREVRLLVDHREDLVAERTRMISRLRWHLHELDPCNEPAARTLNHLRNLDRLAQRLEGVEGTTLVSRATSPTAAARSPSRSTSSSTRSASWSAPLRRRCLQSADPSPPPRSLPRPPALTASRATTPTHVTTAPPPCRCGHPTEPDTDSAAPATGS